MQDNKLPVKLGTYGKLLRAIWPELNIDAGPIGLLDELIAKSGVSIEQLIGELRTLPILMQQYVERQAANEARQERIEASLTFLVREIEAAKERTANGRNDNRDSDGDNIRSISAA